MPNRLIFLGSLALGNEEEARAYGDDPKRDMAGVFERIAPFVWRLVIPFPQDGAKLRRVRADAGRRTAQVTMSRAARRPGRSPRASDRRGRSRSCADLFRTARASRLRLLAAQDARACARRWARSTRKRRRAASRSLRCWWCASRTGFPGRAGGSSGGATAHGYDGPWEGPKAARFIRQLQQKTFDYWAMAKTGRFGLRGGHGRSPPATMCGRSPSPKTMTASASTAGSSGTCPTSASTSCRAGRGPGSCGSTASARRRATGSQTGQVLRVPPAEAAPAEGPGARPKRDRRAADRGRGRVRPGDGAWPRARDWFMLNKPPGLATQGGTKTVQHLDRLLDGLADEDGPAAQAGPPARQGHQRASCWSRASARAAGHFAKAFAGPHRAQGLLGAGRRRAVGRGRADRRAARQAAGHRRREDACRRGGRPAGARPATG